MNTERESTSIATNARLGTRRTESTRADPPPGLHWPQDPRQYHETHTGRHRTYGYLWHTRTLFQCSVRAWPRTASGLTEARGRSRAPSSCTVARLGRKQAATHAVSALRHAQISSLARWIAALTQLTPPQALRRRCARETSQSSLASPLDAPNRPSTPVLPACTSEQHIEILPLLSLFTTL
jgi:hypothetical protein